MSTRHARGQRILLVTRNLPPLVGGMERLNWHLAEELSKVAEVHVIAPTGSAAQAPTGVVVREAPLSPLWKFLLVARRLARREARQWQPDVVLAGSGLTAPLARRAARVCHARAAVYVHGLDVAVRHRLYRALWFPAIRGMDRVIANSRATAALCRAIGVDEARMGVVHPGVDLPAKTGRGPHHPISQAKGQGSDHYIHTRGAADADLLREGGGPVLLSVGRLSARKGLREFVTQALPRIVAVEPDAVLVIVGDAPKQALHAQAQTRESILEAARGAGVADHLQFFGVITDYDRLGTLYRAADVHVFPVRAIPGDPEGFGMVAVEAAAHGLPTVAFATGGVIDAVAEGASGHLVVADDYAAFADAVITTIAEREALRQPCISHAQPFGWPAFGDQIAHNLRITRRSDQGA